MCTVSWRWNENERVIYFNRDEQRTRRPGLAPAIFSNSEHRYLCPIDQDKGGTWFAANELGLVVGLLNEYRGTEPIPTDAESRGHLVRSLVANGDPQLVGETLECLINRAKYPPFTLLSWFESEVRKWHFFDGTLHHSSTVDPPVTSSSWDSDRVESRRRDFYIEKVKNGNWSLDDFHRHEIPGDAASSVCMTRPRSRTMSLTTCRIDKKEVSMEHFTRDEAGNFVACQPINLLLKNGAKP